MPGLTNKYVEDLAKLICGDSFLGVFPCDIQPKIQNNLCKFSLIFNTDKHDKSGSHFVAIFRNENKLFYFDSFGEKCSNKIIKTFIRKNLRGKKYQYNKHCIQNDRSLFCGLYCISFIHSMNDNKPFHIFLNRFSNSNTLSNDLIVTKMIIKRF